MAVRTEVASWVKAVIGVDLSGVVPAPAAEPGGGAPAVGAAAYTQGNDIRFAPAAPADGAPLAHEAAHVVQQVQPARRRNDGPGGGQQGQGQAQGHDPAHAVSQDAVSTGGVAREPADAAAGEGLARAAASIPPPGGPDEVALRSAEFNEAMKELEAQIVALDAKGLNSSHYKAQAKGLRDEYAAARRTPDEQARKNEIYAAILNAQDAGARAKADVARVANSATEGMNKAIGKLRDGAKRSIDALAEEDKKKPELEKRLGELDKHIKEFDGITDDKEMIKKNKVVNVEAQSLFADAAKANHDDAIIQEVYADALKERYGIEIDNPASMPNTHLEKVYQMFDKVPTTDVVQDKLTKIIYAPLTKDEHGNDVKNTGAAYGSAEIEMGDYGDEAWEYRNPVTGTKEKPNGFAISTLHELGHSVDDRFGIMSGNMAKVGAGGWRSETADSVAKVMIDDFNSNSGKGLTVDAGELRGLVDQALAGTKAAQPPTITAPDWAKISPLLDLCIARRSDGWPWGESEKHQIGDRYYHESYPGEWVSYLAASRAKAIMVRDYQWRAPAEYFAELYAYTYYNSKPAPNGVDAALAAYMYGGKAAEAPH